MYENDSFKSPNLSEQVNDEFRQSKVISSFGAMKNSDQNVSNLIVNSANVGRSVRPDSYRNTNILNK